MQEEKPSVGRYSGDSLTTDAFDFRLMLLTFENPLPILILIRFRSSLNPSHLLY